MSRVSVITPCFNAERYIASTIESVRNQSFGDWEHIVVDDGSSDGSAEAAERVADGDPRVSVVRQPNAGVAAARRRGLDAASPDSDYLVFFDADDLMHPDFLTMLSAHLDEHPEVGLVYCGQRDIDEHDAPIGDEEVKERFVRRGRRIHRLDPSSAPTPLDALVSRFEAIPSTCMFRRSVYEGTIGWRKMGVVEDKDMGIQMALAAPVHFVAEELMSYRHHGEQRHHDRFYESMRMLHDRWWDEDLDRDQRRAVRRAIAFDRRVAAHLSRREAVRSLRAGEPGAATTHALRSIKQTGEWFSRSARAVASRAA